MINPDSFYIYKFYIATSKPIKIKKQYIGKGTHFFPKTEIGQFKIEAYGIKIVDKILIIGLTTGNQEMVLDKMLVSGIESTQAKTGDKVTFEVPY